MQHASSAFFPFRWLAFDPAGFCVRGVHHGESLAVSQRLTPAFRQKWPLTRQQVLNTPGGFEGERAALLSWEVAGRDPRTRQPVLRLQTGYRTYSEGLALKRLVAEQGSCARVEPPFGDEQPLPGESWGSSLSCVVLLPQGRVLAGKRSSTLQSNPNRWSCVFTEVLEPSDVSPWGMEDVLDRLVAEELRSLKDLAHERHQFVGLLLVPHSYTWTLVSVIDLREEPAEAVDKAVGELAPDAETSAWGSVPLTDMAQGAFSPDLDGLDLARDVVQRMAQMSGCGCS